MRPGFRKDIEGLRAVAVLLVLAYHAGLDLFAGGYVGVDVFFVVSGFLITGLLIRQLDATGSIRLLEFYANRARRLLPASFSVLLVVGSIVYLAPRWLPDLLAPQLYGRSISWDIQRSSLYVVNWLFAERSVDYQGGTELASPLQHFWSLSVEEQFYAVWPIVLLGISVASRSSKRILALSLAAITAASLFASYRMTNEVPEQAYFVTTTRVWELSLGGLAAVVAQRLPHRPSTGGALTRLANGVVVGGLLAVLAASMTFDGETAFPGVAALLPTLGTAAVLLGAPLSSSSHSVGLLSTAPLQWVGARSYSIYLWHWPALWLAKSVEGPLSPALALAVVAASILPAMACYRWIEQPARTANFFTTRPVRGLALTGGSAIVGYGLGVILLATTTNPTVIQRPELAAEITTEVAGIQLSSDTLRPSVAQARVDNPEVYDDGCVVDRDELNAPPCSYGNPESQTTVLVIGNSHAAHWTPALEVLAERHDWHLVTNMRSGCRLPVAIAGDGRCVPWAEETIAELASVVTELGVDLVLTMPTAYSDSLPDSDIERIYVDVFAALANIDTRAAVIRPTPHGKVIGIDCPSMLRGDLRRCTTPREEALAGTDAIVAAVHRSGLPLVDMTRFLCTSNECPAVIDDLLVRRDRHHLSRTYSTALATSLGSEIEAVAPELFSTGG